MPPFPVCCVCYCMLLYVREPFALDSVWVGGVLCCQECPGRCLKCPGRCLRCPGRCPKCPDLGNRLPGAGISMPGAIFFGLIRGSRHHPVDNFFSAPSTDPATSSCQAQHPLGLLLGRFLGWFLGRFLRLLLGQLLPRSYQELP